MDTKPIEEVKEFVRYSTEFLHRYEADAELAEETRKHLQEEFGTLFKDLVHSLNDPINDYIFCSK